MKSVNKYAAVSAAMFLAALSAQGQKVYEVDNEYQADVKIYVVEHEYQADLVVFSTDKEYRAKASDNKGIWCFVDRAFRADKKVCFVDQPYKADLKVCFTDKEFRAGWKKSGKKHRHSCKYPWLIFVV